MTNNNTKAGIAGATTGGLLGGAGVLGAVTSLSAATPAVFVPYAAAQVAASTLGISSLLGGGAATSVAIAAVGGPLVVAGAAICLPAVIVGGLFYAIFGD